jgi:hypothetical protein
VSSMQYPAEHRATRLLREMGRQAEGKFEPIVEPAAAQKLHIDPESPLYERRRSSVCWGALGRLEPGLGPLSRPLGDRAVRSQPCSK